MSDPKPKQKEGDKAPTPGSGRQRKLAAARAARKESSGNGAPSSNWEALKMTLPSDARRGPPSKKRSMKGIGSFTSSGPDAGTSAAETKDPVPTSSTTDKNAEVVVLPAPSDSPLLHELRQMVLGHAALSEAKKAPGNYVALDCEMVGLGHLGAESALARVSLVNYHGHVLLDTFVAPRERVTDYRTWVSGIREEDLRGAPPFEEVQKQVAELVEGRVLVGHAIENDTKALLLSHPAPFVRDTQKSKPLREAARTKRPGLKSLVESQLGLKIQGGAHSSITDARATMALYRLHKEAWEASMRGVMDAYARKTGTVMPGKKGKRKREDGEDEESKFPGGGRKGISSGLSVVVKRFGKKVEDQPRRRGPAPSSSGGGNWWEESA
ncbi:hypothetical protein CC85DRAFT_274944 [Cutaneotrichosporon oleaginosum]|uniref:RNA exonuclease 4 n=1 Tax=Cutaneotrichosporon oleaginosum TaxID=879819 RepID=A0A0J0XLZ2_9TREE|nr:uncharacterized protein CC85DRAFT_274944 [Cutaneotrichosporon oleaginosum]KLT42078.1 hypothetical protein CC85DRAFT_274944 [Cutaneotrichosporon oleaginosum]TXT04683.1 hypothetical protein COLE_07502 [Cutaneotrichosporon oleaginosum]